MKANIPPRCRSKKSIWLLSLGTMLMLAHQFPGCAPPDSQADAVIKDKKPDKTGFEVFLTLFQELEREAPEYPDIATLRARLDNADVVGARATALSMKTPVGWIGHAGSTKLQVIGTNKWLERKDAWAYDVRITSLIKQLQASAEKVSAK